MAEEVRNVQGNSPDLQRRTTSWQLVVLLSVLVVVGIFVFDRPPAMAQGEEDREDFSGTAFLSGVVRKIDARDFRRGEATAVMGGVQIDLRDAEMERDEAVLDVSSVMGGIKIRVPQSWTVVSKVETIMGGFKDQTHHPSDKGKKLIVTGTVLMGGLEIEN